MGNKTSDVHVALLRGINVGGKNKLPMAALVAIVEEAGGADVRTYIQSGNVVFRAPQTLARRIPATVSQAIADRHGLSVPLVARRLDQWRAVAGANPFLAAGADPRKLHVAFLAKPPTEARVAALDPGRSPPDEFLVQGPEIFLHCPNGMARTKLTNAYFDATLQTTSTVRNWNTVLALLSLAEGL